MVGAHAQIADAAALSIAARVDGVDRADITAAIAPGGPLVKTYGPRGTVHLLPRDDLPLWCAALSAAPPTSSQAIGVRLDAAQTDQVVEAIATALDEAADSGRELDRDELDAAVSARLGAWASELVMPAFGGMWPRWRQAISTAAHRGVLAFGAGRGTRVTYVNPGVEVPEDGESALDWLLLRYLASYGPATPAQFGRWMAGSVGWANTRFARLADTLTRVDITNDAGVPLSAAPGSAGAMVATSDASFDGEPATGIRLLGHFDPYVVGSYPRDLVFPGDAAARALNRGQAGNLPVILRDGVVAGVWHAARSAKSVAITVEPLVRLSRAERSAAEHEGERIAAFIGLEPRVAFGVVTVGAHA